MIFYQQRVFGWSFWFLLLLSCGLMTAEKKQVFVPKIKPYLQMAIFPLEYAVALPPHVFHAVHDYFIIQHELVHDKKNWQGQKMVLEAQLQQLNALKAQNEELQVLLKTSPVTQNQKYLLTHLIALKTENNADEIMLNAGSDAGVSPGQAVVSGDGIVGQVIQVTPLTCRVMLLSDRRSAIPGTIERSHDNVIVVGAGSNNDLELLNTNNSLDIKLGDRLLSSGIGGHYPAGYPIGVVSSIDMSGKNIAKVHIRPAANFNRLHYLLVVFVP